MSSLIAAIRDREEAAGFLAWPGDFDLDRGDHVEDVHLASGARLEGFAGDGAGGTYFFCGDGGAERPVLYADSEGGAALVAFGLADLLRLLLVAPWWRGCRTFTVAESAKLSAEYAEGVPGLAARRERAAQELGLDLPSEAEVLARVREVAARAGEEFALLATRTGERYAPLFEG